MEIQFGGPAEVAFELTQRIQIFQLTLCAMQLLIRGLGCVDFPHGLKFFGIHAGEEGFCRRQVKLATDPTGRLSEERSG